MDIRYCSALQRERDEAGRTFTFRFITQAPSAPDLPICIAPATPWPIAEAAPPPTSHFPGREEGPRTAITPLARVGLQLRARIHDTQHKRLLVIPVERIVLHHMPRLLSVLSAGCSFLAAMQGHYGSNPCQASTSTAQVAGIFS